MRCRFGRNGEDVGLGVRVFGWPDRAGDVDLVELADLVAVAGEKGQFRGSEGEKEERTRTNT